MFRTQLTAMTNLPALVFLAAYLAVAHARPGIWYAEGGSLLVGGTTLNCYRFSLGTYSSQRTLCGGCECVSRTFLSGSGELGFDHTLRTVTVNGVLQDIKTTQETYGCDLVQVKAYSLACDGPEVIYRTSESQDYVCENIKRKCP